MIEELTEELRAYKTKKSAAEDKQEVKEDAMSVEDVILVQESEHELKELGDIKDDKDYEAEYVSIEKEILMRKDEEIESLKVELNAVKARLKEKETETKGHDKKNSLSDTLFNASDSILNALANKVTGGIVVGNVITPFS